MRESQARACALNFTLIGMYEENLCDRAYARIDTSGFIAAFIAQQRSRLWRPQSFSEKSTQVLVHDAPDH